MDLSTYAPIIIFIAVVLSLAYLWRSGIGQLTMVVTNLSKQVADYQELNRGLRNRLNSLELNYHLQNVHLIDLEEYLLRVLDVAESNFQQLQEANIRPLKSIPVRRKPSYDFKKPDDKSVRLGRKIREAFSVSEIKELAFELDLEPDDLQGNTRLLKAYHLVALCESRQMLGQLILLCQEKRPLIKW